ncbi:MAG: T9SS type A sorting domain-containing protein [Flavobacteriales bacterium]|nr:T9SS type A sorting domain-containing protein [Flavobacteriales bacterium]
MPIKLLTKLLAVCIGGVGICQTDYTITTPGNQRIPCQQPIPNPEYTLGESWDEAPTIQVSSDWTVNPCQQTIIYTINVSDSDGHKASASYSVTMIDDQAPTFDSPPSDTQISCTDPFPTDIRIDAIDNCSSEIKVRYDEYGLGLDCGFAGVREWTATDECGNSSTHTQVVTVIDDIPPALSNCDTLFLFTDPEESTATLPDLTQVEITDICTTEIFLSQDPVEGSEIPLGATTVTITVTDECGGIGTCERTVIVDIPSSINSLISKVSLELFPNPTSGTVQAKSNEIIQQIYLIDISGRHLLTLEPKTKDVQIELATLPTGLYLVYAFTENDKMISRLAIE